jgi:hypothetical protein
MGAGRRTAAPGAWMASIVTTFLLLTTAPGTAQGQVHAALVGGVDGTRPEAHLFYGAQGGFLTARGLGGEVLFLEGGGAGYDSRFVAAGASWRLLAMPLGDLRGWVGPGRYREALADHDRVDSRSLTVGAVGLVGRLWAGPVRLSLGATAWRGSLEASEVGESQGVNGFRIHVGVGR